MVKNKKGEMKRVLLVSLLVGIILSSFVLADLNENWIKVKDLKEGDYIAVFDNESGEIVFEKIESIEVHESQHVFDLMIEDTHNFIANYILAHNTNRFLQYRAVFKSNTTATPILEEVNISYASPPLEGDQGGEFAQLVIWDDSDSLTMYSNYTMIYANYTNVTSGESINGSGVWCEFRHNKTGLAWGLYDAVNMTFNATIKRYELIADGKYIANHTTNMPVGNYSFNISCFDATTNFTNLSIIDAVTISEYATGLTIQNDTGKSISETVMFYANYTALGKMISGVGLNRSEIGQVVWETGDLGGNIYSATFSDCNQMGKKDCLVIGTDYTCPSEIYIFNNTGVSVNDYWISQNVFELRAADLDDDGFHNEFSAAEYTTDGLRWYNTTSVINDSDGYDYFVSTVLEDLNGDSIPEIIGGGPNVVAYFFNGTKFWNTTLSTREVHSADINLDGTNDIIIPEYSNRLIVLYGQNGSIMWNTSTDIYALSVTIVDLDNDGNKNEIMIGKNAGKVLAYNSSGSYLWEIDVGTSNIYDIVSGDFDNDGYENDFAFGDQGTSKIYLYSGNLTSGTKIWDYPISGAIFSIIKGDANNDGKLDVIAGGDGDIVYVIDNDGNLSSSLTMGDDISVSQGYGSGASFDISDINNDGINDIAVASADGYAHILQDVNCIARFNDSTSYNMTWNQTLDKWEMNRTFSNVGAFDWNVTCSKGGYEEQVVSGTLRVYPEHPNVYYSVGINDTNLESGDTGVVIGGGAAYFNESQLDKVGVGDRVNYGSNEIVYITNRINSTAYGVITAIGGTPSNATVQAVNNITRAFNSLSLAEAGAGGASYLNTADLVANNYTLHFPCYADGADTTAVVVDGWVTGVDNYIRIFTPVNSSEVGISQRHDGKWSEGGYRLEVGGSSAIIVENSNIKIEGLQLSADSWRDVIYVQDSTINPDNIYISYNIIKDADSSQAGSGIWIGDYTGTPNYIWNNIIYDFNASSGYGIDVNCRFGSSTGENYVYDNTIINCDTGIEDGEWNSDVLTKNNIVFNCTDAYSGTFDVSSTNNAYDEGADPGSNGLNITNYSGTDLFVDYANDDFHLKAGSPLIDQGTDLSSDGNLSFTDDIDGESRSGTWDIGADEWISPVDITFIYPTGNINVSQNEFFNVTLNVTCVSGSCGTINVSLDPEMIEKIIRGWVDV